jgi:dUTP pyrophosphatase
MQIKIKKLHPNAKIPIYAKDGDAGLDLTAVTKIKESADQVIYGTGISLEIPKGFVGLVFPRSSIRNTQLSLSNAVGVVDSGYRGELQATFNKLQGRYSKSYELGERIIQLIIIPYPLIEFIEVDELSTTDRGNQGFGSTGKL